MTSVLAIETSTLTASVALLREGHIVAQREGGVNSHSEVVLAFIDECLKETNQKLDALDAIAVGTGPGSFTGLRIGMATVKGLCFACDLPLVAVSSMAALTEDARRFHQGPCILIPVMDARRKEVFVSGYVLRNEALEKVIPEMVLAPDKVEDTLTAHIGNPGFNELEVILFGDGALAYREQLKGLGTISSQARPTPSAEAVARLADSALRTGQPAADLSSVAPTYIRLAEAEIKFPEGNRGGSFGNSTS